MRKGPKSVFNKWNISVVISIWKWEIYGTKGATTYYLHWVGRGEQVWLISYNAIFRNLLKRFLMSS
jgi:hypothetical protein